MKRLSGRGTLSGRTISAVRTLNTMALAPIASASVSTAVRANPGAFRTCRRASRTSVVMPPPAFFMACLLTVRPGLYRLYVRPRAAVPFDVDSCQPGITGQSTLRALAELCSKDGYGTVLGSRSRNSNALKWRDLLQVLDCSATGMVV